MTLQRFNMLTYSERDKYMRGHPGEFSPQASQSWKRTLQTSPRARRSLITLLERHGKEGSSMLARQAARGDVSPEALLHTALVEEQELDTFTTAGIVVGSLTPGSWDIGLGLKPGVRAGESRLTVPLDMDNVVVSSDFGPRISPNTGKESTHGGVDLAVPVGTVVRAARAGVAHGFDQPGSCGYGVSIDHGDGWRTTYCHLSQVDIPSSGRAVERGDRIGLSGGARGSVGAGSSTGPHLHYAVSKRMDGHWVKVDPVPYTTWRGLHYFHPSTDPRGGTHYAGRVRVVSGKGGYTYRQRPDGAIKIKPPGGAWSPSWLQQGRAFQAITDEIGSYRPPRKKQRSGWWGALGILLLLGGGMVLGRNNP